jgi:small subunit ribosomal protein S20
MANLKSSKKGILVGARNKIRNANIKSKMKTFIIKSLEAISKNSENKAEIIKETLKVIDKTAAKGVIKKKSASRRKSKLMHALNKKTEHKTIEKPKAAKKVTKTKTVKAKAKKSKE